jgi:hypothetical protein
MSKASTLYSAVKWAGVLALIAGTTVLATEDPNSAVDDDRNSMEILEKIAPDDDGPVDSAQGRTLDLMLMIWTLKNTSSDTM